MSQKQKHILFILLAIIVIIAGVFIFKNQADRETRKDSDSVFQILDIGSEEESKEEEKGEIKKEEEIVVESDGEEIVIEGADKIIVGE